MIPFLLYEKLEIKQISRKRELYSSEKILKSENTWLSTYVMHRTCCIARASDFCLSYQTPANHATIVKHYSSMAFVVDANH